MSRTSKTSSPNASTTVSAPPPPPPAAPETTASPPPPPLASPAAATPVTPDLWHKRLREADFAMRGRLTTPAELFGLSDPAGGTERRLDRAMRMAKWLRGQPSAEWIWVDAGLRAIAQADLLYSRETSDLGRDRAYEFRRRIICDFEVEVEARVRRYLASDDKQRENIAALSAHNATAEIVTRPMSAHASAIPDFDPSSFVAALAARGIVVEIGEEHGLAFRGGASMGPQDFQVIDAHKAEIREWLLNAAALAG